MASSLEPSGAPTGLTARRPAANDLPKNFALPLPQFGQQYGQKFASLSSSGPQNPAVNVGNLLTPPSTVPGDNLNPIPSALNGANTSQGGLPSYNNYAWPPLSTGMTPIGMGTGNTPQSWSNPVGQVRGLFSPSLSGTLPRGNSNSPGAAEALPPPPYDISQLPPLPASTSSTLPAIAAQQQAITQAYMNQTQSQAQTPMSTTTQASPVNGPESYVQRPQSMPNMFYSQSQPSSAQQSHFPPFNNSSPPVQHSPMSAPPQGSRISPINAQAATFPPSSQSHLFNRSAYASYSLPAPPMSAPAHMSGPIMSHMHSPGNPLGIIGLQGQNLPGCMMVSYNSGHAAQLQQQMYGNAQQTPHNERPFKCDQCPQSFNRNHDLKRHKRIHLAVKPFPCGYCEKSFSRKDALKVSNLEPSDGPMFTYCFCRDTFS